MLRFTRMPSTRASKAKKPPVFTPAFRAKLTRAYGARGIALRLFPPARSSKALLRKVCEEPPAELLKLLRCTDGVQELLGPNEYGDDQEPFVVGSAKWIAFETEFGGHAVNAARDLLVI